MTEAGDEAPEPTTAERRSADGLFKIGHLADLHLDSAFRWAGPTAGRRWRRALRDTLKRSIDVALEEHVDAFFLAGDIYEHDLVARDTARFLADELARFETTPVIVAPGNHDYLCPSSIWAQMNWSSNVQIFERDRWQALTLTDGLSVWGIAHGVPSGTTGRLSDLSVDRGGVNIGLFHGAVRDGMPAGGTSPDLHLPFDETDIERAGLHHAFSGHYHTPRHSRLLTYPGNPHPLTFGEGQGRGLVLATIHPDGHVESETRSVAETSFHDLVIDLTEARTSDDIRTRVHTALQGKRGAARVDLVGDLDPDVHLDLASLNDIPSQLDAVQFRSNLRPAYDLESFKHEATVRGQFVRDVLDRTDLPDDIRTAVLTTGLRALDGRDDLGLVV